MNVVRLPQEMIGTIGLMVSLLYYYFESSHLNEITPRSLFSCSFTCERLGFVFSGMNFGLLIAPFLAGAVYERAGYYPVFAVVLGVIAPNVLLLISMIEKKRQRHGWRVKVSMIWPQGRKRLQ